MSDDVPQIGSVQLKIMRVLWDRGRANAKQITEALNAGEPTAHSTVQTLLRQLEAKGAVAHDVEDRTFVFYPLVEEEQVARRETRELMQRLFDGSAGGLVAHLLENERLSPTELRRIRRLIEKQK